MAACAIVPVDSVLLVQVDSSREVSNSLIELEEPVPHQTSTVVRRSVVCIQCDDLVEVFKCKLEAISADLLPYSAEVVHGLDVPRLKSNRSEVVILSFLQLPSLVPAEGSVIVGLEVLLIKFNCLGVVRDGRFEVA